VRFCRLRVAEACGRTLEARAKRDLACTRRLCSARQLHSCGACAAVQRPAFQRRCDAVRAQTRR
jgi:hypothetical protein